MDNETRGELIEYLNEWLGIWDWRFVQGKGYLCPRGNEPNFEKAAFYNSILEEMLAEDIKKSGL